MMSEQTKGVTLRSGLARRIALTIGALLLYRLGLQIPLPGLDATHVGVLLKADAARRVSIFSIGIAPYLMAAVILQIAGIVWKRIRTLGRDGAQGRAVLSRWTWNLATFLAAAQSLAVAFALSRVDGMVAAPAWLFIVSTVVTMTGGTLFLAWLSEWITAYGIGNGIALILVADGVAVLPRLFGALIGYGRQFGTTTPVTAVLLMTVGMMMLIVVAELGRRRLAVRFPGRTLDGHMLPAASSDLSLKVNCAGIIPVLLASWVMAIAFAALTLGSADAAAGAIRPGQPLYFGPYALLIMLFAFVYTASVIDPDEAAARLTSFGGQLSEAGPDAAAGFLDFVLTRVTVIGAAYLAFVCLIPEILFAELGLPAYLAGPSLLLMVCTVLDLVAQARALGARASSGAAPGGAYSP
jgi:preprotein translocase subunit SecY